MTYIIVARNPMNNLLVTMNNEDGEIEQFCSEEDAEGAADCHGLFIAWGYQVLEVGK